MEELFIRAINVSITASFLVLAIICYRFLIKSSPKWIAVLLWGFVALRLLVPFSIESSLSVIPSESTIPPTITADRFPALDTGIPPLNEVINPAISSSITSHPEYSANPFQILISVLGWVWISGMACMLALMTASLIYLRVRRPCFRGGARTIREHIAQWGRQALCRAGRMGGTPGLCHAAGGWGSGFFRSGDRTRDGTASPGGEREQPGDAGPAGDPGPEPVR